MSGSLTGANPTVASALQILHPALDIKRTRANDSTTGTSSTSSTSGSSTSSAGGLDTTFLSLLSEELQNQDPTSPVDPTQMVGQMISLNQLDQLISINQTVTGSTGTAITGFDKKTSTPVSANDAGATPVSAAAAAQAQAANAGTTFGSIAQSALAGTAASQPAQAATGNASPLDLSKLNALTGAR